MSDALLTIGELARATGLTPEVLRAWEDRHAFPVPVRLASGHRRYDQRLIDDVRAVLARRSAGLSLESAIAGVRRRIVPAGSLFAPVRSGWPNEPVRLLSKRAMLAVSHAIEDEALARAEPFVLVGAFERERFYRASEGRWRDLARTARWAAVFADFARDRAPRRGPLELAVEEAQPLRREWAVACESPSIAVCMVAVERARGSAEARRFEMMWSLDPAIVRTVVEHAVAMAAARPGIGVPELGPPPVVDAAATARLGESVLARTIEHLDH
jgi:hypothetical protein